MQGPWSYDDSMGGHTILTAEQGAHRCPFCGDTAHAAECGRRET